MDFEQYVNESRSTLVRFAASVTDDLHLAQDIVQEVLVRAQRNWAHIQHVQYSDAYIRRMIVNEARSGWRRSRRVEPRATVELDGAVADHATTFERREELERQLLRLSTKQRAAVVMRYLEDRPDSEIAAVLGCSLSTVRGHIHRALARMRVELANTPSHPATALASQPLPVSHLE